ncbi:glycosyltransferase [Pelagicoccus sp. SDUM812005]|uniref:glycosyltransferase n=1 Tax=Pelagicoccus sp. SDUM812005 TaxID=3041257 RepID=UPI00280DA5EC|nr:glycosyltransferase [Pelagicoccus sp. SDUM812005]MDQ8182364.1 glycosyltransferase [Pelagicoccus sp. SDUM812005]
MEVSFVVPVHNHLDLTQECLASLQATVKGVDYEVILVNDGSDEATAQGLRQLAGDRVKLVENKVNQGFAHANNLGVAHARGRILVLANNDLKFRPGWLPPLLAGLDSEERVGLVGNVQYSVSTGKIDHAGVTVDPKGKANHVKRPNRTRLWTPKYTRSKIVTGACCAIKRALYNEIGGFDEAFLNGGEDIDLCFRLKKLGYQILVANRSIVDHHVSATRTEPNKSNEWNSRLLQRRWGKELAHLAASSWPDRYLAQVAATRHPKAIDWQLLKEALPRYLTLKKGPAEPALYHAYCEQERNERHWKSTLDGIPDEVIKKEERQRHGSPLRDQYTCKGLYAEATEHAGAWIRETASISIPRGTLVTTLSISGHAHEASCHEDSGKIGLSLKVNDAAINARYPIEPGPFKVDFDNLPARACDKTRLEITLLGVERSNAFAFLGRKLAKASYIPQRLRNYLARFREQKLNKRLAIHGIHLNGEDVFDFKKDPTNPLNTDYVIKHARMGVNLVGWFKAELGIGESARVAAKAIKHSQLPYSLVDLKVNCLASQGDLTYADELSDSNPNPINIFHIDAPQSADIDHHHGADFRKNKYNIAYWAWELPDFPDQWTQYMRYFDEIWAPSNFVRDSIAIKSPEPVLTIPHCIDFSIPDRDYRQELKLPRDKFLFTFAYDLNSYQERKNPKAAIEAFRQAFAGSDRANDVGLVIKVHSAANNPKSYRALRELLDGLPNIYLIDKTLSREMTYGLMKACDSYISLHRSEGFGLTVAESMLLGKPVVSTNWSATSEFVNATNGCPVDFKLIPLTKNHGPYKVGQIWADPDPEHAANYMYKLVSDSDYAATLGQHAQATIKELYSKERIASLYRKRLRAISLW